MHPDISMYGAATLVGHPLLELLFLGSVSRLCEITGSVNMKMIDNKKASPKPTNVGMYRLWNGVQPLK